MHQEGAPGSARRCLFFNECASYICFAMLRAHFSWMDGWMVAMVAVVDRLAAAGGLESRAIAGSMGGAAETRECERAGEREWVRLWRQPAGLSVCVACAPVRGAGALRDGMALAGAVERRPRCALREGGESAPDYDFYS